MNQMHFAKSAWELKLPSNHFTRVLALANKALPSGDLPPTGQKPVMPKAFRAALHASIQPFFTPLAWAFLLTILPCLFFMRSLAVRPPTVFSRAPFKTMDLAMI